MTHPPAAPDLQHARVIREGDMAVIRLPMSEVHGLRVALQPIRAGEPTSTATSDIRRRLDRALAQLEARK